MAIAQKVAGYTLGPADLLRRAMGKKKKQILDAEYVPFSGGHAGTRLLRGRDQDAVGHRCVPFSDYALQQDAHGAGYGLVAYWTAYLKANYPAEYMAALLTVGRATTRTRCARLPRPSAVGWASRCCRRTSTISTATSPRRETDIRFGAVRGPQRRARTWSTSIVADPRGRRAASPTSTTSCARSTRWSATSAPSSR